MVDKEHSGRRRGMCGGWRAWVRGRVGVGVSVDVHVLGRHGKLEEP